MRTPLDVIPAPPLNAIPLLDASSLPDGEDWAMFGSIRDLRGADFELDADRFGRFNVSACYDE